MPTFIKTQFPIARRPGLFGPVTRVLTGGVRDHQCTHDGKRYPAECGRRSLDTHDHRRQHAVTTPTALSTSIPARMAGAGRRGKK